MRSRDLPGRQASGVQREHDLVDLTESALSLLHDHRLEGALPVAGDLELDLAGGVGEHRLRPGPVPDVRRVSLTGSTVLLMAQVLGHLLVQRGLEHVLGELLEQPFGPVRDSPCSWACRTSSLAAASSAEGSGFFFAGMSSSVVITAPSPPTQSARRARNTVRSTVPENAEALDSMASSALDHAQAMRDNGAPIGRVNGFLRKSQDELRQTARRFGMGEKASKDYTREVLEVPAEG